MGVSQRSSPANSSTNSSSKSSTKEVLTSSSKSIDRKLSKTSLKDTFENIGKNSSEISLCFSPPFSSAKTDKTSQQEKESDRIFDTRYNSPSPPQHRGEDLSSLFEGDDVFSRRPSPPGNQKENRNPGSNSSRYRSRYANDHLSRYNESPSLGREYPGYHDIYHNNRSRTMPPPNSLAAELEHEVDNNFSHYDRRGAQSHSSHRSTPREYNARPSPPSHYHQPSAYPYSPYNPPHVQRYPYYQPELGQVPYKMPPHFWPDAADKVSPDKELTPRKRSFEEHLNTTPPPQEKQRASPFSPKSSSIKKTKRSPIPFEASTPSHDYFNAFAMDVETPNKDNHHLPFSPMGPNAFDSLPIPNSNSLSSDDTPIPLERKENAPPSNTTPFLRRRSPPPSTSVQPAQSPFSAIMGDCNFDMQSPFPASPFPQYNDDFHHRRGITTPPKTAPPPRRINELSIGEEENSYFRDKTPSSPPPRHHLFKASPVLTHPRSSNSSMGMQSSRERFHRRRNVTPSSPFRLQIGSTGMKQSEPRKALQGLNSAMRKDPRESNALMPSHRHNTFPSPPHPTRHRYHMGYDYDDRSHHHPPSYSSSSRGGHYKYSTPYNPDGTPSLASSSSSYYSNYHPIHGRYPSHHMHHQSIILTPSRPNKENDPPSTNTIKKASRRAPCNCKRSKCLKLYCECFAAEQYCDGCNCHDCSNTPEYESVRLEAMKTTRAKNPNAFKPRFAAHRPILNTPEDIGGHNMGCRCKKSACLKKYCECFEAGVMCGEKCKCVDCLNFIGSQALIDRRRKIKDHRGAELAMKSADEAWKNGRINDPRRRAIAHHPPPSVPRSGTRLGGTMPYPPPPPAPRSINSYVPPLPRPMRKEGPPSSVSMPRPPMPAFHHQTASPVKHNTITPIRLLGFNAQKSKIARKIKPGDDEPTIPVFGENLPQQPKTTALTVLSFLSNDDLYNACLVSKTWNGLAFDEELWQFS